MSPSVHRSVGDAFAFGLLEVAYAVYMALLVGLSCFVWQSRAVCFLPQKKQDQVIVITSNRVIQSHFEPFSLKSLHHFSAQFTGGGGGGGNMGSGGHHNHQQVFSPWQ